jgi:hypothetical protein
VFSTAHAEGDTTQTTTRVRSPLLTQRVATLTPSHIQTRRRHE